jgi:predicted TIM-barrel fold metal-dependent hydrolase
MTGSVDAHSASAAALVGAHRAGGRATDHDQVFNKTARRVYRLGQ